MRRVAAALLICFVEVFVSAQRGPVKPLEIWVVDVEGGKAALYVTPTGQTAIIDTGFPGERDLDRILAAIADAGVKQIDYLVSTHYHVDHIGNLVELARRVPVGTFVDHGPTVEGPNVPQVPPGPDGAPITKAKEQIDGFQAAYADLYNKAKHLVVKPGDRLPITGVEWRIATSAGQVLKTPPLPGGGKANPYCAGFTPMAGTTGLNDPDDAQSVGSVIILGQFRAADFGDMWRTKELELMCPNNPLGTVDLLFASSHGAIASGSLPFVHGMRPRVVLMQNGTRKGGAVEPMKTILSSPGLENLWQMHWSYNAGIEQNAPAQFIANVDEPAQVASVLTGGGGRGSAAHTPSYWLKVSASPDGSFTITNPRNGFSKTYAKR